MIIILSVVIVILMGMLGYVYVQLLNAQRRSGMVLQQQQQQENVEQRHKLRTPIVAMQQSLSILADQVVGPLTEEQQQFVAVAQRNLEQLNALIR